MLNLCLIHVVSVFKILEQDKYSLQKEVELKTRMLESTRSDFDDMKNKAQEEQHDLELLHSTALRELNGKVGQHISLTKACKLPFKMPRLIISHLFEIKK